MTEHSIQRFWFFFSIISISSVWFKTGVWWMGLTLGWIGIGMIGGVLSIFIRLIFNKIKGYHTPLYPSLAYSSVISLVVYLLFF